MRAAAADAGAGGDGGGDAEEASEEDPLFTVRPPTAAEAAAAAAAAASRIADMPPEDKAAVRAYVTAPPADAGEAFLREFIAKQKWRFRAGDEGGGGRRDGGGSGPGVDEDEAELERADTFEAAYNFRCATPLDAASRVVQGGGVCVCWGQL